VRTKQPIPDDVWDSKLRIEEQARLIEVGRNKAMDDERRARADDIRRVQEEATRAQAEIENKLK
jgi:hypothetical protein